MEIGIATRSRGRYSTLNASYRDRSPGRSRNLDAGASSIQRAAPSSPPQRSVFRSAAAEQHTHGEPRYRGNADRFPRLCMHVTIRRLERLLGLALRLSRTVRDRRGPIMMSLAVEII